MSHYSDLDDSEVAFVRLWCDRGYAHRVIARAFGIHSSHVSMIKMGLRRSHPRMSLADRLLAKINKNGPVPVHRPELGSCWIWTGGTTRAPGTDRKYGKIAVNGASQSTHRVAFFLEHEHWPEPMACHHCDNTLCARPSHLFEGTAVVNMRDAAAKGRTATGANCGRSLASKLTHDDIRAIRTASGLQREIASQHGIDTSLVSLIRSRKVWAWVPDLPEGDVS